jgi:hypothetical protein
VGGGGSWHISKPWHFLSQFESRKKQSSNGTYDQTSLAKISRSGSSDNVLATEFMRVRERFGLANDEEEESGGEERNKKYPCKKSNGIHENGKGRIVRLDQ